MSIPLNSNTRSIMLNGQAGQLECAYDLPQGFETTGKIKGIAVVAHPNPQQGGSMDNKVVHTIARALIQRGYMTWRFNYRGVQQSEGAWDEGRGETQDMLTVIQQAQSVPEVQGLPLLLAGFSFGSYVTSLAAEQLTQMGRPAQQHILVGPAINMRQFPALPKNSLVIHGEQDELIPMNEVIPWCHQQSLPITIVPAASHFFHGELLILRNVLLQHRLTDSI